MSERPARRHGRISGRIRAHNRGEPMKPTKTMRLPGDLPGYEILRQVGRGGMGDVYVARQLALGRLVAIKFLHLDAGPDLPERIARFRHEAELMGQVSHPNVLAAYDFQHEGDRPYLVMEYVEAGDLRRQLTPGVPMPVGRVRAILTPVGDALQCLHRRGILHRDLKPENILMHEESNPKVADFGIAVLRAVAKAGSGEVAAAGTLGYVAPEQHDRLKVDERADQYSLAAVAYEMLTGEPPLGTTFRPPSHRNAALTGGVDAAIMRALSYDKDDRFEDLGKFREALDRGLAESRRPQRARVALVCALSLGCAAISGAFLWSGGPLPSNEGAMPKGVGDLPTEPGNSLHGAGKTLPPMGGSQQELPPPPTIPAGPRPWRLDIGALTPKMARIMWAEEGSHKDEPAAVSDDRWRRAERRVAERIDQLAYPIYERRIAGPRRGDDPTAGERRDWQEGRRLLDLELGPRVDELKPPPASTPRPAPPRAAGTRPPIEVVE